MPDGIRRKDGKAVIGFGEMRVNMTNYRKEWLNALLTIVSPVLLGGISYSEISGWNAILYWYLSGAYPVMIAFEVLAVMFGARRLR